jgi:hypothetical protein
MGFRRNGMNTPNGLQRFERRTAPEDEGEARLGAVAACALFWSSPKSSSM